MSTITTSKEIAEATDRLEFIINSIAAGAIKDQRDARLRSWRGSLKHTRELLDDHGKIQIAMVGTTGAGKSTLLNAVLEHELLPTGVMEPCTSFVTTVTTHRSSSWTVEVLYISRQDWMAEMDALQQAFKGADDDASPEDRTESNRLARAARSKIAAVFGIPKEEVSETFNSRDHALPVVVERVFARGDAPEERSFQDFVGLHDHLKSLVRGESAVWPLIDRVNVAGPLPQLPDGVELIDLPGLNDPNRMRVEATRRLLSESPHIWVVFNMKRGLTEDIHNILHERGLLRRLILGGNYSALALVGTHADDVDADNAESLGLSEESDFEAIYREYRRQTREKAREQVAELVGDMRRPDDHVTTVQRLVSTAKSLPVIPTSARAYLRLKGITKARKDYGISAQGDTGIPELQHHLASVATEGGPAGRLKEAQERLGMLCDELEFFFRSPGSGVSSGQRQQARVELDHAIADFRKEVEADHGQARSQYEGYRTAFLHSLTSLVPQAKAGVERSAINWSGIHHKTLQAIVRRNGCFVSPSTGREFDFNDDVASPLLNLLPVKWEHFFTDQIDRVVGDATTRLETQAKALADKIGLILRFGTGSTIPPVGEQHLKWFQAKMTFLRDKCREVLAQQIRERRGRLSGDVYVTAKSRMAPAYAATRSEEGTGMKARILSRLHSHAGSISGPLHESIESDLTNGLGEVWLQVEIHLQRLFDEVRDKAQQIAANATGGLEPSTTEAGLLQTRDEVLTLGEQLRANRVGESPPLAAS